MKGDETTVHVATAFIVALAVIFVALLILTGGRLSLLSSAGALQGLFEPNKFTACVAEGGNCVSGRSVSAENVKIDCGSLSSRKAIINIDRVKFLYSNTGDNRLGDRFEFLLAADYRDKLSLGYKDAIKSRFACDRKSESNYECEQFMPDSPLQFTIEDVKPDDKIVLHITAWKFDEQLRAAILDEQKTFSEILDEFYPGYITSVDIPVKSLSVDALACAGITERSTCDECAAQGAAGICTLDNEVGKCAGSASECPPTVKFTEVSLCSSPVAACGQGYYKLPLGSCIQCPVVSSCSAFGISDQASACRSCKAFGGVSCRIEYAPDGTAAGCTNV
jgi:hypothetical protein